jgi:hypothetical protein
MNQNSPSDILREIKEGDPTARPQPPENTFHAPQPIAKKLVLVWEGGSKASFLYSEMQAFMFDTKHEPHRLVLHFISHKVTMTGFRLDLLFDRFVSDEPFTVVVVSERYTQIESDDQFFVTQAVIEP